jgi:4-hydroxybenzoate polyprenyltransferase
VVKDLEDMEGDARYNCRTMPIAWGIRSSKVYAAVWLIVLGAALFIVIVYAFQVQWWMLAVYLLLAVLVPLFFVFRKLRTAVLGRDYGMISNLIKLVMLTGILSILFFKLYI